MQFNQTVKKSKNTMTLELKTLKYYQSIKHIKNHIMLRVLEKWNGVK